MVGASGFNEDVERDPARVWSVANSELDLATRKLIRIAAPGLGVTARSARAADVPAPPPAWWRPEVNDDGIPGWIDVPSGGVSVKGSLAITGWAKSPAGEVEVRIAIAPDGAVPRIERLPRPDVAAALPQLGDCSRAGFRALLASPSADTPFHSLVVELRDARGRVRRLGPIRFRWTD